MLSVLVIGVVVGMFIMALFYENRIYECEDYRKAIKNFGDYIALIIYQEKRIGNKDVEGMKQIQEIYEKYFEEEMEK